MTQPTIALKIDVDTFFGTRDGVPRLMEILARFGIHATFYFSLGPDNSGKALRRIFKKGFLVKQLRSRAPSAFGLKTMLYGTLLSAPVIGLRLPDVLRWAEKAGHEVGIHCWDHVKWHDYLLKMQKHEAEKELSSAGDLFREILGRSALTTAAPGWTVSPASLEIQDTMGLSYCSDTRGAYPFFPVMGGKRFNTLQIPTTWPTMDELLGVNGITPENINDHYISILKPGLNVHTIHAEMEGKGFSQTFSDLVKRLTEKEVRFITLSEAASEYRANAPSCEIFMRMIPGRAMPVAIQSE